MKFSHAVILIVLIGLVSSVSYCKKPVTGNDLPQVQLKDLNGADVDLAQLPLPTRVVIALSNNLVRSMPF